MACYGKEAVDTRRAASDVEHTVSTVYRRHAVPEIYHSTAKRRLWESSEDCSEGMEQACGWLRQRWLWLCIGACIGRAHRPRVLITKLLECICSLLSLCSAESKPGPCNG